MNNNIDFLKKLIELQTISSNPSMTLQMVKAANLLQQKLESLGFTVLLHSQNNSAPCVVAQKIISKNAPTIGIYGHYDVQPVATNEAWESPEFALTQREGKFYARGVADNKGHIVQNITAIQNLIKNGQLNNNIIFVIEGEEEVGSSNFESILRANLAIINRVNVWFVTDTGMKDKKTPQVYTSLRGLVYLELKIKTGQKNLHSGICGNLVYNAGQVMSEVIASLKSSRSGKVLVDGFYNDVKLPEFNDYSHVLKTDTQIQEETGTFKLPEKSNSWGNWQKVPRSFWSKFWPSLDVHGITCGHAGEGAATVIPNQASAKFSCRLVAGQNPQDIAKKIRLHIHNILPAGSVFELKVLSVADSFSADTSSSWHKRVEDVFAKHFDNKLIFNASGGTIPAAAILQKLTESPVILTGFTLPNDNIHSANENMDIDLYHTGIEVLEQLYK